VNNDGFYSIVDYTRVKREKEAFGAIMQTL